MQKMKKSPLVSILVCTYNRCDLLRRCITSVLKQDFKDFELIIIDDCSTDNTQEMISSYTDERIRYVRHAQNIASVHGDTAHIKLFINELSRGCYFVYLCDDDYWISDTLLSRQVALFNAYTNVAMVVGGQVSFYAEKDKDQLLDISSIKHFDYKNFKTKVLPDPPYYLEKLHKKTYMSSEEFLVSFAEDPVTKNIVAGATLYSKEHFLKSGALQNMTKTKWQAGYVLSLCPAMVGNVVYVDEPSVVVDVRETNASFRASQLIHYHDSVASVCAAFSEALQLNDSRAHQSFLKRIKKKLIRKVSYAFLGNTLYFLSYGSLTLCTAKNLSCLVRGSHVMRVYIANSIIPSFYEIRLMMQSYCPGLIKASSLR